MKWPYYDNCQTLWCKFVKAKEHLDELTVLEKELEEWWETITVRAAAATDTP